MSVYLCACIYVCMYICGHMSVRMYISTYIYNYKYILSNCLIAVFCIALCLMASVSPLSYQLAKVMGIKKKYLRIKDPFH